MILTGGDCLDWSCTEWTPTAGWWAGPGRRSGPAGWAGAAVRSTGGWWRPGGEGGGGLSPPLTPGTPGTLLVVTVSHTGRTSGQ